MIKLFISIIVFVSLEASHLENITLQLKWKNQFQFAGYYVAKELGYYEQVGLQVNIQEAQPNIDIVKKVENAPDGGIYGVGYPNVILEKANGAQILLLNAFNQLSPHILLTHKNSKINTVEDFKGKTIMISKDETQTASFIAMLHSHHINLKDMYQINPTYTLDDFIDHKVDIITSYISNEPYRLKKMGIAYKIWNPADHGFDFYDDILFTSTTEVNKHPRRVEAFQEASLRGWRYAYNHIDKTVDIILKKYNSQDKTRQELLYEAYALKKLAFYNNASLGDIQKDKIKRIVDIYNLLGLLDKKINTDNFIFYPSMEQALSQEEKQYLQKKQNITLCVNPNKLPFESLENDRFEGVSADYFKLIEKRYHLHFQIVPTKNYTQSLQFIKERKCDILSLAINKADRSEFLNFTAPYLYTSLAIATKKNTLFITNIHLLEGKILAISKEFPLKNELQNRYPHLHFITVNSLKEGLELVKEGKIFAFIGSRMRVSYVIEKDFLKDLKISGKLHKKLKLRIAVRNDDFMLYTIMQKAVTNIDRYEVAKIIKNWKDVKYVKEIDYELIYNISFIFLGVIATIFLLYKREKTLKQKLSYQNIVFETIINTVKNPMFYKDKDGIYQNVNDSFAKHIIGIKREEIIGKSLDDLSNVLSSEEIAFYKEQDTKLYATQKDQVYETKIMFKDGTQHFFKIEKNLFHSKKNKVLGYVGFMYDITDIKKKEEELEHIASTDPLTKLYNRRYFTTMSQSILKLARRTKQSIGIIMVDIDDFKKVNDTYGHKIGDDVIVAIANSLQMVSRESDIACRFGGEEFLLLLPDTTITGTMITAEKIRSHIENIRIPFEDGSAIQVSVSVGVSLVDIEINTNLEEAIKKSDDALYKAKENGKNRVEVVR